jgi:hypothetical protein
VHTEIWQQLADDPRECLCFDCMLKRAVLRLGRMLVSADLRPCLWNSEGSPYSWFDLFEETDRHPRGIEVMTNREQRRSATAKLVEETTVKMKAQLLAAIKARLPEFVADLSDEEWEKLKREEDRRRAESKP